MNSIGVLNGITRRQGIDYPLLTSYLPFTHQLVSRRLVAGCLLLVAGYIYAGIGRWLEEKYPAAR
jgi:hypothetical protein